MTPAKRGHFATASQGNDITQVPGSLANQNACLSRGCHVPMPKPRCLMTPFPLWENVSVTSECCNKYHRLGGLSKWQAFISHSSRVWEVQDQGADRFRSWWGPPCWLADTSLCLHRNTEKWAPVSSSSKDTNPLQGKWGGASSWTLLKPIISLKPHLQTPWGFGASTYKFGVGGDKHSVHNREAHGTQCHYSADGLGTLGDKSHPTVKVQTETLQRAHLPCWVFLCLPFLKHIPLLKILLSLFSS